MEKLNNMVKEISLEDFKEETILRVIAETNLDLAVSLSLDWGGCKAYIQSFGTTLTRAQIRLQRIRGKGA